jgi:hypothetical protein
MAGVFPSCGGDELSEFCGGGFFADEFDEDFGEVVGKFLRVAGLVERFPGPEALDVVWGPVNAVAFGEVGVEKGVIFGVEVAEDVGADGAFEGLGEAFVEPEGKVGEVRNRAVDEFVD